LVVVDVVGATSTEQEGESQADGRADFHRCVLAAQSDIF
jgi:hypothetical protein